MVEKIYQKTLEAIYSACDSGDFSQALNLSNSLEVELSHAIQPAPVAQGWLIYFKIKIFYETKQYQQGLRYLLENRAHCRRPPALGLNFLGVTAPKGKFVVISTTNLAWIHSVCSEMALESKQYDQIAPLMRDTLAIRILSEDLEGQFFAATTALSMLDVAERQSENSEFAFFLLNFGCIAKAPGAAGRGVLALVDNYLQTRDQKIFKLLGIMMHRRIWHNAEDEIWQKEIATKIATLGSRFDPTRLSDEEFHATIIELGAAANRAFDSGDGHTAHAYHRAIYELQIAHGRVYFAYYSRAIAGMISSLALTDQFSLANDFLLAISAKGAEEYSESALMHDALSSGALKGLEEELFIFIMGRAHIGVHVIDSIEEKEKYLEGCVAKVWSSDSYNKEIFPYLQMHYEHLCKKISGGLLTSEQQAKVLKNMGSYKVDIDKYPHRIFPKLNEWVICTDEADAVFASK